MRNPMLPTILVFMLLFSSSAYAFAFRLYGLKVGYSSASQELENFDSFKGLEVSRKSGLDLGVFTEWRIHRRFTMVIGLGYEQKGMKSEFVGRTIYHPVASTVFHGESRLDYLSVPVMARCRIMGSSTPVYLVAGPRVDIMLGHSDDGFPVVIGLEDEYKDVVFGVSAGLGIERSVLGSKAVSIEAVFNYDPFWLYEAKNPTSGTERRIKNESLTVSIGVGL